ncbi:MAG: ATP-binding protein [Gammaproteobacteria bacterium]|nr:ATP-binding protein [Gammaproteobacteria bacterium]
MSVRRNAASLDLELDWFKRVLDTCFRLYFGQECEHEGIGSLTPPSLKGHDSEYARLVAALDMSFDERIVLILALVPHIRPQLLDTLFIDNKSLGRAFTEFGGWSGKRHSGFQPTGETAAFVLAGNDLEKRLEILRLFDPDHFFTSRGILRVDHPPAGEPFFSGALLVSGEYLTLLTTGAVHKPDFSVSFPAKRVTTRLQWEDLVLAPDVVEEVENIKTWLTHEVTIMDEWGLGKSLKPGYRSLFYGPPGTGKTLTASLIGASAGLDVYRIDLSMVVSKYIGETEKNLAHVFEQAQNKRWILFFDEADALFGKRTQTSSSNDRYANQEISYLLQRLEDFPGVVILATNLKANIDDAFARRFQSLVYFAMPDSEERLRLWRVALVNESHLADDVDLESLAEDFELSGGAITNVVRYAAISALREGRHLVCQQDFLTGITKELRKEGKTV